MNDECWECESRDIAHDEEKHEMHYNNCGGTFVE